MGAAAVPAAIIGGSVVSGVLGSSAAKSAAKTQAKSADAAAQAQLDMYHETKDLLSPYVSAGNKATTSLTQLLGAGGKNPLSSYLLGEFNPTMEELQNTPGYKFQLQEAQKAAQNSYAARGLGSSGNALAGATTLASGLAAQNYQQAFNNDLAQRQAVYNMLTGLAGLGENAAAGTGNAATTAGSNIASNIVGSGNAQAASQIAASNALSGGIQSGISNALMYQYLMK